MTIPRLFDFEVSKGSVPGYSVGSFAGVNPNVGKTFETVWDQGGNFVFPTAGETWEVLSASAADTDSAGTGARKVVISGLDVDYIQQIEIVNLAGTTPVTTARTDWFRIRSVVVIESGSGEINAGDITIRVSGGGLVRSLIIALKGTTFNGFLTVPANKIFMVQQIQVIIPKGIDIVVRNKFKVFGTNTFITGGDTALYQNVSTINFRTPVPFPEKTDFEGTVLSTNVESSVAVLIEGKFVSGVSTMPPMGTF